MHKLMEEEMVTLYHHLDALLPEKRNRVIQFMSSRSGEGTSTVVSAFASAAAGNFDKKVLIIEVGNNGAGNKERLLEDKSRWREVTGVIAGTIYQAEGTNLFVSPASSIISSTHQVSADVASGIWDKLRDSFDMILVDSSPAVSSPDGVAIARNSDGVVLVVEAEKTRGPVVKAAKDRIISSGGRILGLVFNKRRHYIPEKVYRTL